MSIDISLGDDGKWDKILHETILARDNKSDSEQLPKLFEARRLFAKAVREKKVKHTDMSYRKESHLYYLGGYDIVLVASNAMAADVLKDVGLPVVIECCMCQKAPCVLQMCFAGSNNYRSNLRSKEEDRRTLYEVLCGIVEDGNDRGSAWEYTQAHCIGAAMSALQNGPSETKRLPSCVIGEVRDLRY